MKLTQPWHRKLRIYTQMMQGYPSKFGWIKGRITTVGVRRYQYEELHWFQLRETESIAHFLVQFRPEPFGLGQKTLHPARVELNAGEAFDLLASRCTGESFTVGPVGNHGV